MSTTTMTRERPILMSAPMVLALLAGRKTMTRRTIVHRLTGVPPYRLCERGYLWDSLLSQQWTTGGRAIACPYGQVGDRLWVREAWAKVRVGGEPRLMYRADNPPPHEADGWWKPSIHMKRCDSRLTLELTGVRVEKLQAITEADAEAEGCHRPVIGCALDEFFKRWEIINGEGSWQANPWVWALTFKVLSNP